MNGCLVDSNIILDIFLNDPEWADWSEAVLTKYGDLNTLYINMVIYAEVSIGFDRIEDFENAMQIASFELLDIPKEALFLAGKAYLLYKQSHGKRNSPLPDFYIGAQAAVMNLNLITRDVNRYITYFPTVKLITP